MTNATLGGNVLVVGNTAFRNNTSLQTVNIPLSVSSIGSSAFRSCNSITSTLTIAGNDVATLTDAQATKLRRDVIGFVFQDFGLLPTLTVAENVALPLGIQHASSKDVRDLIERVGLSHRVHHRPEQLSGGEMQRTAIARALVRKPRLLLADEPTGNLDSASGDRIVALLQDVNKSLGVTLVIVTHNPALAALAERQLVLVDGHLVDNS
jgi:putative ABC transport system ATP-binding protein